PADARPTRTLRVDNTDEWLTEIAGGLAIGVTAESTVTQHAHPGVVFVPVSDAEWLPVQLVWSGRYPHPAIVSFVELVVRVVSGD
ncbi:MAG: LysR substrate-binding domain-containing protein, partial [Jatrophihabitans sp.]